MDESEISKSPRNVWWGYLYSFALVAIGWAMFGVAERPVAFAPDVFKLVWFPYAALLGCLLFAQFSRRVTFLVLASVLVALGMTFAFNQVEHENRGLWQIELRFEYCVLPRPRFEAAGLAALFFAYIGSRLANKTASMLKQHPARYVVIAILVACLLREFERPEVKTTYRGWGDEGLTRFATPERDLNCVFESWCSSACDVGHDCSSDEIFRRSNTQACLFDLPHGTCPESLNRPES